MRKLLIPAFGAALAMSGAALAQSSNSSTPANTGGGQPAATQPAQLANAQRVKQDLEKAGFSDVRIVAESFVVQAKSKDGDPILMTIGPHGFTLFEAENASHPKTTGSTANSGAASSGSSAGSTHK